MISNISQKIEGFSAVPLHKIPCNYKLAAAVYVKVGDKFIKFKELGDVIPEEKYNYFISKNVKELFILNEDKQAFEKSLEEFKSLEVELIVEEVGEANRSIVLGQIALREIVYETFLDETLSNETVAILRDQVNSFIEIIKDRNPSSKIFAKISSMNNTVAEHSLNVANLSILFGMAVGQNNTLVLENLYMGALFHDYGKAKISDSVMGKPNSIAYMNAIKGHPEATIELLKNYTNIPKQVLTIVAEHHEYYGGFGYPRGISGDSIYGLSKIVSIANIFDNIVTENRRNTSIMYKTAIKVLEYDKGKQFDPILLPRILDVLKMTFENYKRERKSTMINS